MTREILPNFPALWVQKDKSYPVNLNPPGIPPTFNVLHPPPHSSPSLCLSSLHDTLSQLIHLQLIFFTPRLILPLSVVFSLHVSRADNGNHLVSPGVGEHLTASQEIKYSKHWLFLTHWGLDKMDAILHTFLDFYWMKHFIIGFEYHSALFLSAQLTICHHWFR